MPLAVQLELRIVRVGRGTGPVLTGQSQGNNPGTGQLAQPIAAPMAQMMYFQDAEAVPGTDGSTTLANINTALTAAVTAFAGASGTPLITTAKLAEINAWNTGSP